jgi:CMP-N-acetylneuraminic acid synthetase
MKITAVIPIRKGSERVKDKNVKAFSDTSLLEFKINALKKVNEINEIVVNTDSEIAIEIAIKNNVKFHRRESFYASSECPANDYFWYLGEHTECDLVAYTPVTNPFIKPETFKKCIELFDFATDRSIVTASVVKEFLWRGDAPLNFSLDHHPKSQDLTDILAINFGLCLLSRETLIKYRTIIGPNPKIYAVSHIEGLDIDTPLDFFIAEQVYDKLKENSDFFNK